MKLLKIILCAIYFSFGLTVALSSEESKGKKTFIWEVEFKDPEKRESVPEVYSRGLYPIINRGSKLPKKIESDGKIDEKDSIFFRSNEYNNSHTEKNLNLAVRDMKWMKRLLKRNGLLPKAFHLYMSFDSSELKGNYSDFNAYMSLLSDMVFTERMGLLKPTFSIQSYSQKRNAPNSLHRKGVIRVTPDNYSEIQPHFSGSPNKMNVEIRGLRSDINGIHHLASELSDDISSANFNERIKNLNSELMLHYGSGNDPIYLINLYRKKNKLPLIKKEDEEQFRKFIKASVYHKRYYENNSPPPIYSNSNALLPFMGLEFHPLLNEKERDTVRKANEVFVKNLSDLCTQKYDVIKQMEYKPIPLGNGALVPRKKYTLRFKRASKEIHNQLKKWAVDSNYRSSLETSLFERKFSTIDSSGNIKKNANDFNYLVFLINQYLGGTSENELTQLDIDTQKSYDNSIFKEKIVSFDREIFRKHIAKLDRSLLVHLKKIVKGTELEAVVDQEIESYEQGLKFVLDTYFNYFTNDYQLSFENLKNELNVMGVFTVDDFLKNNNNVKSISSKQLKLLTQFINEYKKIDELKKLKMTDPDKFNQMKKSCNLSKKRPFWWRWISTARNTVETGIKDSKINKKSKLTKNLNTKVKNRFDVSLEENQLVEMLKNVTKDPDDLSLITCIKNKRFPHFFSHFNRDMDSILYRSVIVQARKKKEESKIFTRSSPLNNKQLQCFGSDYNLPQTISSVTQYWPLNTIGDLKICDQNEINSILSIVKSLKREPNKKVNFKKILEDHECAPVLQNINLAVKDLTYSKRKLVPGYLVPKDLGVLQNIDFTGVAFYNVNAKWMNFSGSIMGKIHGSNFKNSVFELSEFKGKVSNSNFSNALINQAKLDPLLFSPDVDLAHAVFEGVPNLLVSSFPEREKKNIEFHVISPDGVISSSLADKPRVLLSWEHRDSGFTVPKILFDLKDFQGIIPIRFGNKGVPYASKEVEAIKDEIMKVLNEIDDFKANHKDRPKGQRIFEIVESKKDIFPHLYFLLNKAKNLVKSSGAVIVPGGPTVNAAFLDLSKQTPEQLEAFKKDNQDSGDLIRDFYDLAIIHASHEFNVPIFGICRGAQMLGLYYGANVRNVGHNKGPGVLSTVKSSNSMLLAKDQISPGAKAFFSHSFAVESLPEQLTEVSKRVGWDYTSAFENGEGTPITIGVQYHPEMVEDPKRKLKEGFKEKIADLLFVEGINREHNNFWEIVGAIVRENAKKKVLLRDIKDHNLQKDLKQPQKKKRVFQSNY